MQKHLRLHQDPPSERALLVGTTTLPNQLKFASYGPV